MSATKAEDHSSENKTNNSQKNDLSFHSQVLPPSTASSWTAATNQQVTDPYPHHDTPFASSHYYPVKSIDTVSKLIAFPNALRFKASVLPNIVVPLSFFTLWATGIWALATYVTSSPQVLTFPPLFISVISLVLSLLLVFRTNTAYDRYWDGRKQWGSLISCIRNLSRIVLISVEETTENDRISKETFVNVLLAVFVAEKKHLRNESGLLDEHGQYRREFSSLLPPTFFKGPSKQSDIHNALSTIKNHLAESSSKLKSNKDSSSPVSIPVFSTETNFTLTLCQYLNSYLLSKRKANQLDIIHFSNSLGQLNSITEVLSQLERIVSTPIPSAYNIHLKQVLYVFLLLLPFQMLQLKAATIFIVFVSSFILLGIAAIASEIENPFGLDANDLPLNSLQEELKKELEEQLTHLYFTGKKFSWENVWSPAQIKPQPKIGLVHRRKSLKISEKPMPQNV
ncbi:hypothetical protein HMI54_000456 [Coelomomyces lativittatus]|nr:hypothetical protein HMI56_001551 [Coelomomyces lativittatus]KAJ1511855.1 hypothetical protein HMI54_000456 [Coelomomyces lativittatus]